MFWKSRKSVVAGRFELSDESQRGGMGTVYRARPAREARGGQLARELAVR